MSLADQFRNLNKQAAAMRQNLFGEPIVIYKRNGVTVGARIKGNPSVGTTAQTLTEGGVYDQSAISYELMTADLAGFVPEPEMFVDARGQQMRIAPDGVTAGLINYRIVLVARKVPRR